MKPGVIMLLKIFFLRFWMVGGHSFRPGHEGGSGARPKGPGRKEKAPPEDIKNI